MSNLDELRAMKQNFLNIRKKKAQYAYGDDEAEVSDDENISGEENAPLSLHQFHFESYMRTHG